MRRGSRSAPPDDPAAKLARMRRAAELRRRVDGLPPAHAADDGPAAYVCKAEAAERVALLRARHGLKRIDPRVVAAQAAFRMGRV